MSKEDDDAPRTLTITTTSDMIRRIDALLGPGARRASFAAAMVLRGLDAEEADRTRTAKRAARST